MCAEVLALAGYQLKTVRSTPDGAESALRSGAAQRVLLDGEISSKLLDHAH